VIKFIRCQIIAAALGLFSSTVPAFGQDVFKPGYVVPVGRDTLRGQVRTQGPQRTVRECVFRSGPDAASTTYLPTDLQGYGLTGGPRFRRGRVPRSSADTTSALRFQEVLVQGPATLLYAPDENSNFHFFLQMASAPGAKPQELRIIQRRLEQDGRIFTQTINEYQQILRSSLVGCPAISNDISRLRFGESYFTDIVRRYNACLAPAAVVAAEPAGKVKLTATVLAGLAFQQRMMLEEENGQRKYNVKLNAPNVPVVGLQFGLYNPRLSRHFSLALGAFFERRNYQGFLPGRVVNVFTNEDHTDVAYGADFIHIPLSLRCDIGESKLRPFLEAGVSEDVRINERDNSVTVYYQGNRPTERSELFDEPNKLILGYVLGGGVSTHWAGGHNVAVRVQYKSNGGLSPIPSVGSRSSVWRLLLSYDLTK
jgi:hypothetical protein